MLSNEPVQKTLSHCGARDEKILTVKEIPVIHDLPARSLERLVGTKPRQSTFNTHEDLLVEIWYGCMHNLETFVDLFG